MLHAGLDLKPNRNTSATSECRQAPWNKTAWAAAKPSNSARALPYPAVHGSPGAHALIVWPYETLDRSAKGSSAALSAGCRRTGPAPASSSRSSRSHRVHRRLAVERRPLLRVTDATPSVRSVP
jgi:hypothetical protein